MENKNPYNITHDIKLCKRCGRRLRTPESQERGYGNICFLKAVQSGDRRALFQYEQENPNQAATIKAVLKSI